MIADVYLNLDTTKYNQCIQQSKALFMCSHSSLHLIS